MASTVKGNADVIAIPSCSKIAREHAASKENSYMPLWLIFTAFSLGLFALWSKETNLIPIFMGLGYLSLIVALATTLTASRDIFNPLCFVVFVGFLRYGAPAILLLVGVEPPEEIATFYRLMGLSDSEWPWAHVLALTSLAGIVFGWFLVHGGSFKTSRISCSLSAGISHAAILGMLIGGAALVVFIAKNVSLGAILTGAIRGATIEEGTGVYFRFIYMGIVGSIILSAHLLAKNRTFSALIPVFICALMLLPLGGRGRAIIPLMCGVLLLWYRNREQNGWPSFRVKARNVLTTAFVFISGTWLFHFIALYRGGRGLDAFGESLSLQGIWEYLQFSIFMEFGHLHSLAGALVIGPGVLGGLTFLGSLTFPLSKIWEIPGRSAGVYIVETLLGFNTEDRWGLHASLIGDAYLNFGLVGIIFVMPVFGMLMKLLYVKFRMGALNGAAYVFAAVYGANIFLKSIEAWPHTLTGLVFIWVIVRLADFLDVPHRDFTPAQAVNSSATRSVRHR